MERRLTVCILGCGDFARFFVPLFKAHPYVDKVYVCDLIPERAREYAKKFDVEIADSYAHVLDDPKINCIANFTQRHLHGGIVLEALRHGKHVYSAVPMASEVDECLEIVETVKKTGLTYMMGETCVYFPSSMYCRKRYLEGAMGRFVYGESQYYHDILHFPQNFKDDLKSAGVPPFYYPTHSTAMILNAADSYVTRVTAMGYEDREDDQYFKKGVNQWDNVFSNEYSLMKLANGGVARVNECRRIAYKAPSSCVQAFYGTEGAYQFNNARHLFYRKTAEGVTLEDVSDLVNPEEMARHTSEPDFMEKAANHVWQWDIFAKIQAEERKRLPDSYRGMPNGHMASHQFLVDDFCTAAARGTLPKVHAWLAARYTIPGLLAHQSALRGGVPIDVPDCGMPDGFDMPGNAAANCSVCCPGCERKETDTVTPDGANNVREIKIETLQKYIKEHYTDVTLNMLAAHMRLNPSYLSGFFSSATGMKLFDYITMVRMDEAVRLLRGSGSDTIAEIAEKVGYSSPVSFTRCFKKRFGIAPSAYRRDFSCMEESADDKAKGDEKQ